MDQTLTCGSTGIRPLQAVWRVRFASGPTTSTSGRWVTWRNRKERFIIFFILPFFHSVSLPLLSFLPRSSPFSSPLYFPQTSKVSVKVQSYCINLPSSSSQYELQVRSKVADNCAESLFWSNWSEPVVWRANNSTGKTAQRNYHNITYIACIDRMKWLLHSLLYCNDKAIIS